jgi:hypothetical protein
MGVYEFDDGEEDQQPRLLGLVRVTAKQSNNIARGRAAHPGIACRTATPTLKGLHMSPC